MKRLMITIEGWAAIVIASMILAAFFLLSPNLVYAQETKNTEVQPIMYAPDRIIVKFNENVLYSAVDLFKTAENPVFNQFINDFKITSVESIVPHKRQNTARRIEDIKEERRVRLADIKSKNSKRISRHKHAIEVRERTTHTYILTLAGNVDPKVVCESMLAQENILIEYCQPDYTFKPTAAFNPDDPFFNSYGSWGQNYGDAWGHERIMRDQTTGLSAWDFSRGSGVIVAVIDTGVDYNHPELRNRMWINEDEIAGNGIDDDNNGFVDDWRGWHFGANFVPDPTDPMDHEDYEHGTWMAGIIAAEGNNGVGIIGVSPEAIIMPIGIDFDLRGSSWQGFLSSQIAQAILYAAENGANVINLSLSPMDRVPSLPLIEEAIRTAYDLGAVIVVAAGNMNDDVINYSPANMKETITVGASDINDQKATFQNWDLPASVSNYGISLDVVAPGTDILTTGENSIFTNLNITTNGEKLVRTEGSSASAAFISGVAALMLAKNPNLTNEDVRQILRVSANDTDAPGFDTNTGYGRANGVNAVLMNKVPSVDIVYPEDKGEVSNRDARVEVRGVAYGPNFKEYQLFSKGLNDPDWTDLTGIVSIPAEPNFNDPNNNASIVALWEISELPLGAYFLKLRVITNNGIAFEDMSQVNIAESKNQVPVIDPIRNQQGREGNELSFYVKAKDPDGDPLVFDASALPEGSNFTTVVLKDKSTAGLFKWTPKNNQAGTYSVEFIVSDGKDAATVDVSMEIKDVKGKNPKNIYQKFTIENKIEKIKKALKELKNKKKK